LVLSNIDSLKEIWQDSAIYVNPDDPAKWAEKINQLIQNPELLKFYAKKALLRARRYRVKQMTYKHMALYNCLLAKKAVFLS